MGAERALEQSVRCLACDVAPGRGEPGQRWLEDQRQFGKIVLEC